MKQTLPSAQLGGSCLSPHTPQRWFERHPCVHKCGLTKLEAPSTYVSIYISVHPTFRSVCTQESLLHLSCAPNSLKCVRSCLPWLLTCPGWVWADIITSLHQWAPQCGPPDLIIQWWWWWHNNHYSPHSQITASVTGVWWLENVLSSQGTLHQLKLSCLIWNQATHFTDGPTISDICLIPWNIPTISIFTWPWERSRRYLGPGGGGCHPPAPAGVVSGESRAWPGQLPVPQICRDADTLYNWPLNTFLYFD